MIPSSLRFYCFLALSWGLTNAFVQTPFFNNPQAAAGSSALNAAAVASLKPAAVPMMDSGKALARSGELLIDVTKTLDLYGGGLSAAGAEIRNAGDSVAQAAASARFKTGMELVIDELRESGTCLLAAADKLCRALEEAIQDEDEALAKTVGTYKENSSFSHPDSFLKDCLNSQEMFFFS